MDIRQVNLIGLQNLQNAMLEGYLGQSLPNTSIKFIESNQWNPNDYREECLTVIDCLSVKYDVIEKHMTNLNKQKCPILLIQVEPNSPFEQLVQWPNLKGIVYRNQGNNFIKSAITAIIDQQLWLSRELMSKLVSQFRQPPHQHQFDLSQLTKREKQVFQMAMQGLSNDQMATALEVSINTVKTHLYNVFKKLDVTNRMQLHRLTHANNLTTQTAFG